MDFKPQPIRLTYNEGVNNLTCALQIQIRKKYADCNETNCSSNMSISRTGVMATKSRDDKNTKEVEQTYVHSSGRKTQVIT